MDHKKCFIVGFFWVAILAPLSLSEIFELNSSPSVIGAVGQDAVLTCQISLGTQPQNMVVQWKRISEHHVDNIYKFTAITGQEIFGSGYQDRIELVKEGIATGNVSLRMNKVRVTDEGTYSCLVKSSHWSADIRTVLHVAALGNLSIEFLGPEGEGIKLACRSEGWFPEPELHWLAKNSQNPQIESKQDHEQLFSVYSTIIVMRDSVEITCSIQGKSRLQKKQEVTLFLSQNIFPQASPWLHAFWILFLLVLVAVAILIYFKYKGMQKRKHKQQKRLLQETERKTMESEIQDMQKRLERTQSELDFRRARSYLGHIRLDPEFKHPDLEVTQDGSSVHYKLMSSGETINTWPPIIIGTEGFKNGRQYWEVRVDDKPNWELGVLTEKTRNKLKMKEIDASQEVQRWSLRKANGQYYPEEADCEIQKYTFPLKAVGIFLDMEDHFLSFYDIKGMQIIVKIHVEAFDKMYPFFSPGVLDEKDNGLFFIICQDSDWDFPLKLEAH